MKAMAQKFGGGGQEQSPAQAAVELAGKRLIPGHALPHVVLHTVQVGRMRISLFSAASERVCVTSFDTRYQLCFLAPVDYVCTVIPSHISMQAVTPSVLGAASCLFVDPCHHTRFAFRSLPQLGRCCLAC